MSVSTIFNFNSSADYAFDTNLVEFVSGLARLKLLPTSNDFTQDFASSSGFVFDAAKTEFVGGVMRQKDQRQASAAFGVTYTSSINANWGDGTLTGTATGGASVAGGKLDLTGGTQKYVDYDADLNADSQQVGAIRFRYTPNYSGIPASDMNMFCISATTENDLNSVALRHNSVTGNIFLRTCDQAGNYINANIQVGQWLPTSGTEYEIELDYDFTAGVTRVFINGVQLGTTATGTGTRSSTITKLRIGCFNIAGSYVSNFSINDFMVFSTVQHTANYTKGYTVSETIYVADVITAPEMEYTGPGALQQITGIATTETNGPRYNIQVDRSGNYLYWNGGAWAVSNGTFTQADTKAVANLHLPDLDIVGSIYGQFRVFFTDGSVQQSIDILTATMVGQQYSTANPSIDTVAPIRNDGIENFIATVGGTGTVKFVLKKNGTFYYWSGSAWTTSDGSYAQSNTSAEILTNMATFTITPNDLLIRVLLHSTGTQPAWIDNLEINTNFTPVVPSIKTVIVWVFIDDIYGANESLPIYIRLNKSSIKYGTGIILDGNQKKITPINGYIELTLPDTTTMEPFAHYIFTVNSVEYKKTCPNTLTSSPIFGLPDY